MILRRLFYSDKEDRKNKRLKKALISGGTATGLGLAASGILSIPDKNIERVVKLAEEKGRKLSDERKKLIDKIDIREKGILNRFKTPDDINEYINNFDPDKELERMANESKVETAANELRKEVDKAHDIKQRKLLAAEKRLIRMKRNAALKKLKLGALGSIAAGVGTGFAANHYFKNKEKKK